MKRLLAVAILPAVIAASPAMAEDDSEALAKQLSNPLATLISVPFQGNYNSGIGPAEEGEQYLMNVQPVIPFSLNDDWNLISRTIVPVISQDEIFPGAHGQLGIGNTTQSLFFSPANTANGWTWGVGPVLYLPTNSNELLGPEKWGIGPTAVALWQGNGWTIGALGNQIWSVAGNENDADINATYLQPFISYTTKDAWTFTLNTEATYDWENDQWSVPLNAMIGKLVHFDKQPISFTGGVRYWAVSPDDAGPEGWGARLAVTFLFPK